MECFTVYRNEIDEKLDCHFYRPKYTNLDKKIKRISEKKLGDYIISISGGSTPDIKQSEKYYTDVDKEIPFLRVQNVTPEGLKLDDVKYINVETHNGLLKRSQVKEFNLLTKITGVGRMAVSSVAPKGFSGNINQHLVVIKTENEIISKVLATFLNSDIGERLASKRSTGGTRPALDYSALKSIPIVFKPEIVNVMEDAYLEVQNKETEAQQLIDSINDYIISELCITPISIEKKMCYSIYSDEMEGRFDPHFYRPEFRILKENLSKLTHKNLSEVIKFSNETWNQKDFFENEFPYIEISEIDLISGDIQNITYYEKSKAPSRAKMIVRENDIIVSTTRPHRGAITLIDKDTDGFIASTGFAILRDTKIEINKNYLLFFLRTQLALKQMIQRSSGGNYPAITYEELKKIIVPLPPISIQNKIDNEVKRRMEKAKQLQKEAKFILEKAAARVEKMILGDEEV